MTCRGIAGDFALQKLTHVSRFNFLGLFLCQPLISSAEASLFNQSHSACRKISVIGFDLFLEYQSKKWNSIWVSKMTFVRWWDLQWHSCNCVSVPGVSHSAVTVSQCPGYHIHKHSFRYLYQTLHEQNEIAHSVFTTWAHSKLPSVSHTDTLAWNSKYTDYTN